VTHRTAVQRRAAKEVRLAEDEKAVLDLRKQGCTYAEVAERLGMSSASQAYRVAQRALAELPRESAEEVRAMELERLDAMHRAVWDAAISGDLDAFDRALKVAESRRKLLGLDAPQKHQHAHVVATYERLQPLEKRARLVEAIAALQAELAELDAVEVK
jgi:transcriptional regulator with XRE-family HTH domain